MRILIVTSEVTFVKDNYNQFLENLFKTYKDPIVGLIVLKNNNSSMLLKGVGLIAMGAKQTGLNLIKNSIKAKEKDHEKVAAKYGIKTHYFKSSNDEQFLEFVKKEAIDLIVNARTRDIYKAKILKAPTLGCINIHHGLLPEYRGTMCDLYALFENRPAGFSVHKMEKKIDNGALLKVVPVTDQNSSVKNNFPQHIYESSIVEGKTMAMLLKKINEDLKLPISLENKSENVIYTKNPDHKMIKRMLKKGMIL